MNSNYRPQYDHNPCLPNWIKLKDAENHLPNHAEASYIRADASQCRAHAAGPTCVRGPASCDHGASRRPANAAIQRTATRASDRILREPHPTAAGGELFCVSWREG